MILKISEKYVSALHWYKISTISPWRKAHCGGDTHRGAEECIGEDGETEKEKK